MYLIDADVAALADRCEVVDDTLELENLNVHKPPNNIGALWFRNTAGVTR